MNSKIYNLIKLWYLSLAVLALLLSAAGCGSKEGKENYLKFKKISDTHEYFAYKADSTLLISGHRGTKEEGYPENSIEGFQQALSRVPLFFEVDPRLTKDSVIGWCMMRTIDRTTMHQVNCMTTHTRSYYQSGSKIMKAILLLQWYLTGRSVRVV